MSASFIARLMLSRDRGLRPPRLFGPHGDSHVIFMRISSLPLPPPRGVPLAARGPSSSWGRSRRLRLDSSLVVAASAANYKWLFVRWNRWLNGRERNRLINERQEEREEERSRMDAKTAPNKLFGRGKKGTAGRGGRQKGKPTRERHFQMQMKTEWSNEKADEERGMGERNNKSVIDRGRAARGEWQ